MVREQNITLTEINIQVILSTGSQKGSGSTCGWIGPSTEEISNRDIEMAMGFGKGNRARRTRVTTYWIENMGMASTTGLMGMYIREISWKTRDAEKANFSITINLSTVVFG
jgi:hypothetical protein